MKTKNQFRKLIAVSIMGFAFTTAHAQWSLTGNTGTTAGTNFIGTTDNQDLVFKTGSTPTEWMRISTAGNVGIGTSSPIFPLHMYAPAGKNPGLLMQDADVSHGITDLFGSTNTWATSNTITLGEWGSTIGGGVLIGASSSGSYPSIALYGIQGVTSTTDATILLSGAKKNGSTVQAIGASEKLFQIENGSQLGVGTRVFTILGSGNTGIGTTAPAHLLELGSDDAAKPSTSTWTISSDRRLKTDITPYTSGLDIIRQVNLVNYRYNGKAGMPTNQMNVGVIAQDFQKVLPNSVKTFNYSNKETGENETYLNVNFHELFMVYLNAIKELDARNTELEKQLNELKGQLNGTSSVGNPTGIAQDQNSGAKLLQNNPNPFRETTTINYELSQDVKTAVLYVYDMQGKQVKSISINGTGKNSVTINGGELNAGMYMYSLIADGKVIDTKRMILTE